MAKRLNSQTIPTIKMLAGLCHEEAPDKEIVLQQSLKDFIHNYIVDITNPICCSGSN